MVPTPRRTLSQHRDNMLGEQDWQHLRGTHAEFLTEDWLLVRRRYPGWPRCWRGRRQGMLHGRLIGRCYGIVQCFGSKHARTVGWLRVQSQGIGHFFCCNSLRKAGCLPPQSFLRKGYKVEHKVCSQCARSPRELRVQLSSGCSVSSYRRQSMACVLLSLTLRW
jgi:hypothetical protein